MMRNSLILEGLDVPAHASVNDIARFVTYYVETGSLSEEQARLLVLDCLESSNKRAYLFTTPPGSLAGWTSEHGVVAKRADASISRQHPSGAVQYVSDDGDDLRIVMAETHVSYSRDKGSLRLIPTNHVKVIVILANRTSGVVSMLMDVPGEETTHGGPIGYKAYYVERMKALLGLEPEPLNLSRALTKLEGLDIIEVIHSRAVTAEGKLTYTAGPVADVRKFARFKDFKKDRIEHDTDEYSWLPREFDTSRHTMMPVRPLKTFITSREGEVRFGLHALAKEVDYVLGHLRTHA